MPPARNTFALALLGACATLAIVSAPYQVTLKGFASHTAMADSGNGKGGNDSGGNSGQGGGNSGQGGGGNSGNSGQGGGNSGQGGGNSGNSGQGGGGNSGTAGQGGGNGDDNSGWRGGRDRDNFGDGFGRRSNEHINPVTGDKVEINGNNIEVLHPDGIREEIENGYYEMTDARGRTIIRRRATESDRARLRAMIG